MRKSLLASLMLSLIACDPEPAPKPVDADGDGYAVGEDCDDADAAVSPAATEVCDNADRDEDCDGSADDLDPEPPTDGAQTGFADLDADGFGDPEAPLTRCDPAAGFTTDDRDCDDGDAAISPDGTEICDPSDADEDCDGYADDADGNVAGTTTFAPDDDGDGFGDQRDVQDACEPPAGTVADATDCDDGDPSVSPDGPTACEMTDIRTFCVGHDTRTLRGDLDLSTANDADLEHLVCLTALDGDLILTDNRVVTTLAGLANLGSIGGNLHLEHDESLTDLGLGGVTTVGGDVEILKNGLLGDLSGLGALTSVGRSLLVKGNPGLRDLSGLDALASLGADLTVDDNDGLLDLTGLPLLLSLPGDLVVVDNDLLPDLSGLALTSVGRGLDVEHNLGLVDLSGLDTLITLPGDLRVGQNPALLSLSGLDQVASIGGAVEIRGNDLLPDLTGLNALITVGRGMMISDDDALRSLSGLDALTSLGGGLTLDDDAALVTLDGLGLLQEIGGDLAIRNDDALLSLAALQRLTSVTGDVSISDNDLLCSGEVDTLVSGLVDFRGAVNATNNLGVCPD